MEDTLYGLALSAGVCGLELGIRLALGAERYRTVCYVEWESYAASTLVARMEAQELDNAPIWDDVKTFDGKPWRGIVDILSGGYPCQPFSDAGLRRGTSDPRHLFPHFARIIRECEPTLCFFENVGAHLRLGFREVKSELENLHYRVEAGLFSAEQIGAPHERERLFILAVAERAGRREMELSSPRQQSQQQTNQSFRRSIELGDAKRSNDGWGNESELGTAGQEILQPHNGTRSPDRAFDGSETLENAAGNGRSGRHYGDEGRGERPFEIERPRGELGNTERRGLQRERVSTRQGTARERTLNLARSREELEYPAHVQRRIKDSSTDEERQGTFGEPGFDIPLFPPRPDDYGEWRNILSCFPFVAPTIQKTTEPDVYRMVDGTPVGVDAARYKDQLSCVGNSVSPIVAAFAFRVLARRIGLEGFDNDLINAEE